MTELFNETEVTLKSPRLKWMERHGIVTEKFDDDGTFDEEPWRAAKIRQDVAYKGATFSMKLADFAYGATEDEALTRLCQNLGLKLWNEEGV